MIKKPEKQVVDSDFQQQKFLRNKIIKEILYPYFEQNNLNEEFIIEKVKSTNKKENFSCYHIFDKKKKFLAVIGAENYIIYHNPQYFNLFEKHFSEIRFLIEKEVSKLCEEFEFLYSEVPFKHIGKRKRLQIRKIP
jgi:predicted transcriptional regulator